MLIRVLSAERDRAELVPPEKPPERRDARPARNNCLRLHGLTSVHDATVDAVEYLPAAHASHFVAPADRPVLVIEPAAHPEQYDLPPSDWYCPAPQSMHDAMFDAVAYLPA